MLGRAQTLFSDKLQNRKSPFTHEPKHQWPLVEKMLSKGCLSYIDFAIAQKFNHNGPEEVAAFLCHLAIAARNGHLCIKIKDNVVVPNPSDIWLANDPLTQVPQEDFELLNAMIANGAQQLPPALINHTDALIQNKGSRYYFHKCWELESDFLSNLTSLLSTSPPELTIDKETVSQEINALQTAGKLLPEQAAAIIQACESRLTLITGGPGTGKTYTAGVLLAMLWKGLAKQKNLEIILAAPTGKAAANLEASIKRSKDCPPITGQTLHQLLKAGRQSLPNNTADIIIVDECSMVDANLMGRLLSIVKRGARLILLGDKNQLPSVEAGSLFADLVGYLSQNDLYKRFAIELKTCLRTESKGISELTEQIKQGNTDALTELFSGFTHGIQCHMLSVEMSPKEQQQLFLKQILPNIPIINDLPDDLSILLDAFNRFRILTPLRNGLLGSEALNEAISSAVQARSRQSQLLVMPIMIVKNDARQNLFNGDVGILIKENSDYAIFPSRQPNAPVRKIPLLLLPKFEPAYCLSVHKSQGSEFDHVALLLPEGAQVFGREGLYTGVSRAKKQLDIWSRPDILKAMVNKRALRQSGVNEEN